MGRRILVNGFVVDGAAAGLWRGGGAAQLEMARTKTTNMKENFNFIFKRNSSVFFGFQALAG
jgi:hypothetical protein